MSGEVPTDVPPAAFGRFRVLHQIGVGSLGPVFRAEDPETHQTVAIKLFRLNLAPELAGRVAEQLRRLATAIPDHPGLVKVIDAGLDKLDPYLVTELATGESLDVALREYGPASIGDALPRLHRLADAIDRAAAKGIWHGALQPRDLLVSAQTTQMTGLGVVPILEAEGIHRPPRRPYAAPEIIVGRDSSSASDQYALAAITYEWLFGGRAPRSAESVLDAPALVGVNAEVLASALMTALAANPTDRFANCRRFVAAIDAAVTDAARSSRPPEEHIAPAAAVSPPPAAMEPKGVDGLLPDDQIVEIVPPSLSLSEYALDAGAPEDAPTLRSVEHDDIDRSPPRREPLPDNPAPLAWQGTLGSQSDQRVFEKPAAGFTVGTLVAVLLGALAVGGVGGYLLGTAVPATDALTSPPSVTEQASPTTPPTPAQRESTEVPVAAPPPPAADAVKATPAPTRSAPVATPAPTRPAAQLLVSSTPSGANVTVDGTPRGTTPLTLRDLALGTRTIEVSRSGFASAERRVTLTADRPSRSIDIRLTPVAASARPTREPRDTRSSASASLVVDSRPSGATVTLDGQPAGVTPLTIASVTAGTHTVRVERAGYRPVTQTIAIQSGERRRFAVSLEAGQQDE